MKISIVVAIADNLVIGKGGTLPWHLPDDLKFFKQYTHKKPLLMGRKTFDSIGKKPLPHRLHLIVSRQQESNTEQVLWFTSIEAAIKAAAKHEEVCIVGGAEIYRQAIPYATHLVLTRVHAHPEGDTFFPKWDEKEWQLVSSTRHSADECHPFSFTFETYQRISQ